VTIAVALLGQTNGLQTSASLFSVNVTAEQTGTGQLIVDEVVFRDLENGDIVSESQSATIEVQCAPVAVETVPDIAILHQNYPNPFNPSTAISFDLLSDQYVELSVYDVSGKLVETLISGNMHAGSHSAMWNSRSVSSGVYYSRLVAANSQITKKMTLVK
jgi:hypothetical protein